MKTSKLIEIAKTCGFGECEENCPFSKGHRTVVNVIACSQELIAELARELEKVTNTIPVGSGENYEVTQNENTI